MNIFLWDRSGGLLEVPWQQIGKDVLHMNQGIQVTWNLQKCSLRF